MSVHAIILANQSTKTLPRIIHAMKAQTTEPEQITVLANIPVRQHYIPSVCAEMDVNLVFRYDPEMVLRQTSHAYHLLPEVLARVRQDRVMIFRDTDIPHLRLLQTLECVFLEDEREKKHSRRTVVVYCRWLKPSTGEFMPRDKHEAFSKENIGFYNAMMSASAVRQALPQWQPVGGNVGNDYDLIVQAQRYGQAIMLPQTLIESDPLYFASIYETKERKDSYVA